MYTPFWFNEINILYDKQYIFEIFPIKEYDIVRKLNAIIRFSIYYSIIVYCYNKNTNILAVPFITGLVTYLIWKNNSSVQLNNYENKLRNDNPEVISIKNHNIGCQLPTKDNPFMNTMFYDTHHQEPSRAVHNAMTWVSNVTGSPCGLNPCGVCIERKKLGLTNPI